MPATDRKTVGIIGLRQRGLEHARKLRSLGRFRIVGADVQSERRRAFIQGPGDEVYETPGGLLETNPVAVVIATPNKLNEELTKKAIQAGCDIYLEKPVAHTLDSAERIVDLVQDTDRICMVGFVHRYWNNCAVLKAYIEDDLFGDIYHFEGRYSRRRGVPGRGTWYTSDNVAGGGALMDLGTHVVDLLLYLLDYPDVSEIASKTRANFGGQTNYAYLNMFGEDGHSDMFDVEDSASAFVEFEDGTTAIVEAAWAANREPAHTYIINGKRAGADLDIAERSLELRETRDMGAVHHIDSTVRTTENDAHKTALEAFFDAIQSRDTSGIPTVEEGLRVQRIIDQIYEQNESP